jgi:archaeal cell division control protein 6
MSGLKKNIFSNVKNIDQSIFVNESVFYPDYTPENIFSRDQEITELTLSLKPLTLNKRTNNFLIYGPPGTGKTLTSNFILNELSEYSIKVKFIYINCIQENTRFSIMSNIVSFFGGIMPRRGLAVDELWTRIKELFKKSSFMPVIILDEIDKLNINDASSLLYDLSRFSANSKYFTLFLITNNKSFISNLDLRTQSSLFLKDLEFKKYTSQDLKKILKERIKYGLVEDAISEDLIGYISGYAAVRGGDARIAIDLLYKSAKESEKKGFLKISKEILLSSSSQIDSIKLNEKLSSLSKEERKVLSSLKEDMQTTKVYSLFKNISERTIRRYILKFEKLGFISLKQIKEGKGNVREISLNFNQELL